MRGLQLAWPRHTKRLYCCQAKQAAVTVAPCVSPSSPRYNELVPPAPQPPLLPFPLPFRLGA